MIGKQRVLEWIRRALASRGYVLTRVENANRNMAAALLGIARREHSVRTVVDVGASDGRWSELAMIHLPACEYLLVEAQEVHRGALTRFCARHGNAQFRIAAAGREAGEIYFKANRPFGGQASYSAFEQHNVRVTATSIDVEVESRNLEPPFLLKLDTHGFEVPILDGAQRTLEQTEVIVMECYNFRISPECLLFHEMCDKLGELGFRCIDIVDPRQRPYDGSFWQMDMVFVRDDRPELSYSDFK